MDGRLAAGGVEAAPQRLAIDGHDLAAADLVQRRDPTQQASLELGRFAAALDLPDDAPDEAWVEQGVAMMLGRIRASLERMRVEFELWTSERGLHESGAVAAALHMVDGEWRNRLPMRPSRDDD